MYRWTHGTCEGFAAGEGVGKFSENGLFISWVSFPEERKALSRPQLAWFDGIAEAVHCA